LNSSIWVEIRAEDAPATRAKGVTPQSGMESTITLEGSLPARNIAF